MSAASVTGEPGTLVTTIRCPANLASASIVSGLLGLLVGYVVVRTPVRSLATFLRQVTFLPYLVPGIAFATAYLSLFAVPRGPRHATASPQAKAMSSAPADEHISGIVGLASTHLAEKRDY